MKTVFFGTPRFAIPALEQLYLEHDVIAVVTQPDKRKGRSMRYGQSEAKAWALAKHIVILEPELLNETGFLHSMREIDPDVIIAAAYGKILPPELLNLPKYGCINIHASLLPHYRGAAPIQRAIMDDMDKTGVTIMQMAPGMDTGDILKQAEIVIDPRDDAASLTERLAVAGAAALLEVLASLESGEFAQRRQEESLATYAPPIAKEESKIPWDWPATRIANLIRALSPAPGAYTLWHGKRLKIWKAASIVRETLSPGEIAVYGETLLIGSSQGALEVFELQPEGKRRMSTKEFVRGYRPKSGETVF